MYEKGWKVIRYIIIAKNCTHTSVDRSHADAAVLAASCAVLSTVQWKFSKARSIDVFLGSKVSFINFALTSVKF